MENLTKDSTIINKKFSSLTMKSNCFDEHERYAAADIFMVLVKNINQQQY